MKYLKIYEEFKYEEEIIEPEVQEELPIDKSKEVYRDNRGVYHIENWTIY